jgi:hypothetical protein
MGLCLLPYLLNWSLSRKTEAVMIHDGTEYRAIRKRIIQRNKRGSQNYLAPSFIWIRHSFNSCHHGRNNGQGLRKKLLNGVPVE